MVELRVSGTDIETQTRSYGLKTLTLAAASCRRCMELEYRAAKQQAAEAGERGGGGGTTFAGQPDPRDKGAETVPPVPGGHNITRDR